MPRTTTRCAILATVTALIALYPLEGAEADSYALNVPSGNDGSGQSWGDISFLSKTKFHYDGHVKDVCPGDYYGVSTYYVVGQPNGSSYATGFKGWDTNGCDNGSEPVGPDNVSWPANIRWVSAVMCFTHEGNLCDHVGQVSSNKYNPYVP
jgi:hypothetical protein